MRSVWKGYFVINNYLINSKTKFKLPENIKMIYNRKSTVLKFMEKSTVMIYNGKIFRQIKLNKLMHSHKLGEFSFTRKPLTVKHKTFKKPRFKRNK